eukprot:CAMPEP_0185213814 /NCGR_PEP_ID=MMETSP1140-20130426/68221_1 /TAXON_ID=298111 /ORGANISM="Pavlova sp., Strain CCMP459" /LENGTH=109 /DNA_ID=CAMNT_0027781673 /DNA_START=765 /DNA_END=1091 /DNA_ORIENTATION=+
MWSTRLAVQLRILPQLCRVVLRSGVSSPRPVEHVLARNAHEEVVSRNKDRASAIHACARQEVRVREVYRCCDIRPLKAKEVQAHLPVLVHKGALGYCAIRTLTACLGAQ